MTLRRGLSEIRPEDQEKPVFVSSYKFDVENQSHDVIATCATATWLSCLMMMMMMMMMMITHVQAITATVITETADKEEVL